MAGGFKRPKRGVERFASEINATKRQAEATRAAAASKSTTVGAGGMTFKNGGGITIEDGGRVSVRGGGDVTVYDGGSLSARYPNGVTAAYFGRLLLAGTEDPFGHGLLVQASAGEPIFWATEGVGGGSEVSLGGTSRRLDVLDGRVLGPMVLETQGNAWFTAEGQAWLGGDSGTFIRHGTVTGSANVNLTANGQISRVTSSRRYKKDIQDAELDSDLLVNLRPVTWLAKDADGSDPDATERIIGFIAEEVHAVGGEPLVIYDEDGRPDSLAYDRFTAAVVTWAKDRDEKIAAQQSEIDTLKQTVADLAARLDALEAA